MFTVFGYLNDRRSLIMPQPKKIKGWYIKSLLRITKEFTYRVNKSLLKIKVFLLFSIVHFSNLFLEFAFWTYHIVLTTLLWIFKFGWNSIFSVKWCISAWFLQNDLPHYRSWIFCSFVQRNKLRYNFFRGTPAQGLNFEKKRQKFQKLIYIIVVY